MKLVMCGVTRTGSTLIWQILSRVFPEQTIPQTHPAAWTSDMGDYAAITIRDPHDVAASRWRLLHRTPGNWSKNHLINEINDMKKQFAAVPHVLKMTPSYLLYYEKFWNNYDVIFDMIQSQFDVSLSADRKKELEEECGIKANRIRSEVKDNSHTWDLQYKIHAEHVSTPKPGSWKTVIPEAWHSLVEKLCRPLYEEWRFDEMAPKQ